MLLQVLALTPDQVNNLPPAEREAIKLLVSDTARVSLRSSLNACMQKSQFMGAVGAATQ